MAPRAYDNTFRRQQQAELRARIAAAAAELHREKGATRTSYADIAARAGVSVPTVYNQFPEIGVLIQACTGHVASQAPALPAAAILSAPRLDDAVTQLVDAMDRIHAHFEPWAAWREDRLIPALAEITERRRCELTGFIARVLQAQLGPGDHRATAAAWETLLSFATWHRLVREHRLSRAATRRLQCDLLLAVSGPQPASAVSGPASLRK